MLPVAHLAALTSEFLTATDERLTTVLLELSQWIDAWRRRPEGPLRDEVQILDLITDALLARDADLADRLLLNPILWSDRDKFDQTLWNGSLESGPSLGTWKPVRGLWTSPEVSVGSSAWMTRVREFGDGIRHTCAISLLRPPPDSVILLRSLSEADNFCSQGGLAAFRRAQADGFRAVDFSWRCVLEAEISGMHGDRQPIDFPCGIGTESTLWLVRPKDTDNCACDVPDEYPG